VSGWIKVDKELSETIRFKRMVKAYGNALRGVTERDVTRDRTMLLGALVSLWMYADSHIRDDNTLVITLDEIDEIVGVEGFAQSIPADWLKVIDAEHVELPDFLEHNGTSARQRKNNAKRQAKHRWGKKQLGVTRDVTHRNASNDARPDQTRPEETRPESKSALVVPRVCDEDEHAEWEATLAIYPPGAQRSDLIGAERAARRLVEDGKATWEQLREGVVRYAAACKATNRLVLNPVNFFTARDKPWSQPWPIPPSKGQANQDANVSASIEWLRRDHVAG
jgi:hypothetical protein